MRDNDTVSEINLGMPEVAASPFPRRQTRRIMVGDVPVGGGARVSVQSMTTTKTHDIGATLQQIAELTAAGCDIVRVACPTDKDADALPIIARQSRIPVIADIHFKPKYVFQAIEAGCGAVRVNPGNIRKFDDQVKDICKAASDHGVSLRIGVNAGSLDPRLLKKYGRATPEALVESAIWEASLFEENDFHDFKISVKHHDVLTMIQAYRMLSEAGDWPLHLGVTEAGPAFQGTIKSVSAFSVLLAEGIGDTIRVSLSAPPVEEIKVGTKMLEFMGLREKTLEIVSCPSCGRAQVDVWTLAEDVTEGLKDLTVPLRVAVMGCVVNGPGEAREADLGVASGNGKGQIFIRGEVVETVPEDQIVETLIRRANALAEELGLELPEPDSTAIMQVRAQVRFVSQQVTIRNWNEDPDQADQAVQNAWRRLHTGAGEARGALEAGGRSLRIDEVDDLPRVTVVVDAHGAGHPLTEALARLRAIQEELALNYDQRVQDTLGQLLGSTFMDHLRDRIGATQALVGRINKVLEAHATRTDRTALRIVLEPKDAATRQVLEAVGGPAWGNPEVEERVREFLRVRVDEVKREAQGAGLADWRNGLAERLDYRSWYDIHLEHRRGSGKWGPLTSRGYAELSGGARVVMLMMPLVATLAAMYEEMPTGPRPLWLDEAFDGLDAANRATVMKLFREFDLDVLLVGPGRIVNVAAVPVAAIYQVVRAPAPMPGADLVLELWAGGQLETIETPALGASERQDQLL